MPRFLAIDWDAHGLQVVDATTKGGKATVHGALRLPEPLCLAPAEAQAAGQRLKEQLKAAGLAPGPTLVCVGRDRAVLRDIRYPDVPPAEAPDVVRFQTVKDLTFPVDEAVIDYQPVSIPWPTGEKRALAVVLRKDVLTAVKKLCQGAGLKLEVLSVRPFGLVANRLAQTTEDGAATTGEVAAALVLAPGSNELCVGRGRELLFSRSLPMNGAGLAGLLPELRRSLAAFSGQFPGQSVQRIFVAGLTEPAEVEQLTQGLRLPVFPYEPLPSNLGAGVAAAAFAGALGLIQERAAGKPALNLATPKQSAPPTSRKKHYWAAGIAAALLLVVGLGGAHAVLDSSRNTKIRELQEKKAALKKHNDAYAETEKRVEVINAWSNSELVMLDELYDVIARFPDLPGVRITMVSWKAEVAQAQSNPPAKQAPGVKTATPPAASKNKTIGQLVLEATSEAPEALAKLKHALEADRHLKLEKWEHETPGPNQAKGTFKVFRQAPDEYRTVLAKAENTTAPVTGGNRSPGGNRPGFGGFGPPRPPEGGRP